MLQLILSVFTTAATCRSSHAFKAAFIPHGDPTLVRTKPLNMTRKPAPPPRAAWAQMEAQVDAAQEVRAGNHATLPTNTDSWASMTRVSQPQTMHVFPFFHTVGCGSISTTT